MSGYRIREANPTILFLDLRKKFSNEFVVLKNKYSNLFDDPTASSDIKVINRLIYERRQLFTIGENVVEHRFEYGCFINEICRQIDHMNTFSTNLNENSHELRLISFSMIEMNTWIIKSTAPISKPIRRLTIMNALTRKSIENRRASLNFLSPFIAM